MDGLGPRLGPQRTMRDVLVNALENLGSNGLKKFRMKLTDLDLRGGHYHIPRGLLEDADADKVVDLIRDFYGDSYGTEIILEVLQSINERLVRKNLREDLDKVHHQRITVTPAVGKDMTGLFYQLLCLVLSSGSVAASAAHGSVQNPHPGFPPQTRQANEFKAEKATQTEPEAGNTQKVEMGTQTETVAAALSQRIGVVTGPIHVTGGRPPVREDGESQTSDFQGSTLPTRGSLIQHPVGTGALRRRMGPPFREDREPQNCDVQGERLWKGPGDPHLMSLHLYRQPQDQIQQQRSMAEKIIQMKGIIENVLEHFVEQIRTGSRQAWDEPTVDVGLFTRSDMNAYHWLWRLFSSDVFRDVVKVFNIIDTSIGGFRTLKEGAPRCRFAILHQSKIWGRVLAPHVADGLHDDELRYLHDCLGKQKVIVVIDNMKESGDQEKTQILTRKPGISQWAQELFLFSVDDTKTDYITNVRSLLYTDR